jgi:hypothetical protein
MVQRISPEQYFKTKPKETIREIPKYYYVQGSSQEITIQNLILYGFLLIGGIVIIAYIAKKLFEG